MVLILINDCGIASSLHDKLGILDFMQKCRSLRKSFVVCMYSIALTVILSWNNSHVELRLQICWLFAQSVICYGMSQHLPQVTYTQTNNSIQTLHTVVRLSYTVLLAVVPIVVLFWDAPVSVARLGIVSILKACRWVAVIFLVILSTH